MEPLRERCALLLCGESVNTHSTESGYKALPTATSARPPVAQTLDGPGVTRDSFVYF